MIFDPQAEEEVWCQDEVLFDFFQGVIHPFLIRNQWWSLIVLPLCFSKVAIGNGSFYRYRETNPLMLFGLLLHITWIYALHS